MENVDLESLIEHSQDVDQVVAKVFIPPHKLRKFETHGADVPFVHAADETSVIIVREPVNQRRFHSCAADF